MFFVGINYRWVLAPLLPQECLAGAFDFGDGEEPYFENIKLRVQDLAHAVRRSEGWVL